MNPGAGSDKTSGNQTCLCWRKQHPERHCRQELGRADIPLTRVIFFHPTVPVCLTPRTRSSLNPSGSDDTQGPDETMPAVNVGQPALARAADDGAGAAWTAAPGEGRMHRDPCKQDEVPAGPPRTSFVHCGISPQVTQDTSAVRSCLALLAPDRTPPSLSTGLSASARQTWL